MRILFSVILIVFDATARVIGQQDNLLEPLSLSSVNGVLDTTLTLEIATHTFSSNTLTSRTLNGTIPGPTFRVKPGDTVNVLLINNLEDQGSPYVHNAFSAPDETNIHFHGLHVSGELPSDDTTHVVRPGESYQYSTKLPADHMPGTHWLHPHRHGSTSLQVGGGAASILIVEDAPGSLPPQVEGAREVLMMTQQIALGKLQDISFVSNDVVFFFEAQRSEFLLVNGQLHPVIPVSPGEWTRLRVVYAGWLKSRLDLSIPGCEMQLLAKDGIYIRDFPRGIEEAPILPGGRADIMVRCMGVSTTYSVNGYIGDIATIQTLDEPIVDSTTLEPWEPTYPEYLSDLRNIKASPGCACDTNLGSHNVINGRRFNPSTVLHETYLGSVAERAIDSGNHPYHQHVYPFQIVSGFGGTTGYSRIGDWHDTVQGSGVTRFRPDAFTGKMMVHCHRLNHEDKGMMSIEYVNHANGSCVCGSTIQGGLSSVTIVGIVVGLGVFALLSGVMWLRRYELRQESRPGPIDETKSAVHQGIDDYGACVSEQQSPNTCWTIKQ